MGDERGRSVTIFCQKCLCLTVPRIFVGEPLCVSQIFWYRKFSWIRGGGGGEEGGVSRFSVKSFLSHITKTFRRGTIHCFMLFGYQKNLCLRGDFHDFLQKKLFSHSTEKLRRGTFLCFTKSLVSENFMDKRGGGGEDGRSITTICQIFFVSQYRKISERNFSVFHKVSSIGIIYV